MVYLYVYSMRWVLFGMRTPLSLVQSALLACVTELQEGVKQKCKVTLAKKSV